MSAVWSKVHIDLIGPLPESKKKNKYILTVIDAFSRFAFAVAIPDKKMFTVARAMVDNILSLIGCPDILYSDRGLEFSGHDFKEAVKLLGINQKFTTSFNPQSNGLCERYNKTLIEILRCLVYENPLSWDESLSLACLAYNSSYSQSIKECPYYVSFLRDPKLPFSELLGKKSDNLSVTDYVSELTKRASQVFKMCKSFSDNTMIKRNLKLNTDRKFKDIKVGDRVFVKINIRRHKFVPKFEGPFRVIAIKGSTVYVYSLASKKHRQVTMDKVRFVGDLSDEDAIIQAFPENEPTLDEDIVILSQTAEDPDTSGQGESRVSDVGLRQQQSASSGTRKSKRNVT